MDRPLLYHLKKPDDAAGHATVVEPARAALREQRVVWPDDHGPGSHSYRMLRTQLLQRMQKHALRTVGIVSAGDGEGKTLTAVNLALAMAAEPNQSILLVDLDLRRPSIARTLGLGERPGVTDYLLGKANLSDLFVRLEGVERLSILPAGEKVHGSSEMLASARGRALIGELETRYANRLLIVDLPPVLMTDDVLIVAPQLDAWLLVASEGRTRRDEIARLVELLAPWPCVGSVLNASAEVSERAY